MKRGKAILFAVVFLLLSIPVTVAAATGNKYSEGRTGAVLPTYKNVVEINIDPARFDKDFVNALKEAEEKASNTTQYKIIIPPGTYKVGHQYRVPSNTHIYAKGATIYVEGTRTGVLVGMLEKKTANICIEGGTWTTLKQPGGVVFGSPFCYIGVKNLIFKDMTIKVNRKGHIIEVADIYGLTIEGCKISGNNLDSKEPLLNVQPKEAIQLDAATKNAMGWSGITDNMYNGNGCHKVLIRNNTFTNCARAVGSHSYPQGVEKNPYTYITVTKNRINNCIGEGIYGERWKDSTISYNTVTNCRQTGIHVALADNILIGRNTVGSIRRFTGSRQKTYDPQKKYGCGILARSSNRITIQYNTCKKIYTAGIVQERCTGNRLKSNKISGVLK